MRTADGTWVWVESLSRPVSGGTPGPTTVFSLRDATARIEARRALHESERRFRTVVQHSYDVVAVVGPDATVRWATENVTGLLGWAPEELVGRNGLDLVHPDHVGHMVEELERFVGGVGVPNPTPVLLRRKDGSWLWVEIVGTDLLANPDVAGIVLSLRDVSARVAAEQDRQRFVEICDLSTDLVGTVELGGGVVYLNPAGRRFFGLGPDDPLERFSFRGLILSADGTQPDFSELAAALARNESPTWESRMRRADGVLVPFQNMLIGHREPDGRLRYVTGVSRDLTERKAAEERLQFAATHDWLTSLPNRALLLDRLGHALARARRSGRAVAVLFCDLDNFKDVNDSLGHSAGDRLLQDVAARLQAQLRPGDTVGRFGGDEFLVLCEDIEGVEGAVAVAKRVEHAFASPFDLDGDEVYMSVSIGVATCAAGSADADTLVRQADLAMYRAKEHGRHRYELFDASMSVAATSRLDVGTALHHALERGELELSYEPVADLRSGALAGFEAHLTWQRPAQPALADEEVLAVAEETGLAVPIGRWVLARVCHHLRDWRQRSPAAAGAFVVVAVSGRQLRDGEIATTLRDVLPAAGLDGAQLYIEVPEAVLASDAGPIHRTLADLRGLGVGLAVGAFGSGSCSIGRLRRLRPGVLKVERGFVDGLGSDPADTEIAAAVIGIAHALGMLACAVGVDAAVQRDELVRLGCDRAQGPLFGQPVAAQQVPALLATA